MLHTMIPPECWREVSAKSLHCAGKLWKDQSVMEIAVWAVPIRHIGRARDDLERAGLAS
jgi:hypothetical protein